MVRYLNPADYNLKIITNSGKDFAKRFNFKDIKFSVQIRDIQKIEKKTKNSIGINVFGYENKVKYPIYVSKNMFWRFFIDRWRAEKVLYPYQIFQYIHVWLYIKSWEKNIFVVIVCNLLEQQKNWSVVLNVL